MGRVLVQDPATGYSAVIELVDPEKAQSRRLQGAGLRWGVVGDDELTQDFVARNVGKVITTLIGRLPYTRSDGTAGVATMPRITLPPGKTKAVNVAAALRTAYLGSQVATVGLEFEYEGEPGTVVMSAHSISKSGNQVFRVPLVDPAAERSSTGGYPWIADGDQDTVLYLKNTTDQPQHYVAHLKTAGVVYMIGQKVLEPGMTVEYNIRSLRDLQVPDENGNTIPLEATHGHFKWSAILEGEAPEQLVMIGRAEHFNIARAMSSTYACASCCGDSTVDSYLSPVFDVEVFADDVVDFDAVEVKQDCYGDEYHTIRTLGVSWNSSDGEVASVNSSGTVTALNGGETTIEAFFSGRYYYFENCYNDSDQIQPTDGSFCGSCGSDLTEQRPRARVRVKPRITSITPSRGLIATGTSVTIEGRGFGTNPSVIIGGTGVSYSGSGGSVTHLTGTLNAAANATAGNHSVQVANQGQTSNSVNFFVQVPTKLRRDSISELIDQSGGCGATRNLSYTLLDQADQPIDSEDTLKETISNFSGPEGLRPPAETNIQMASGMANDRVGYLTPDANCPPPFTASFTQTFTVVIGTHSFPLTTSNSISMGRTSSGTKFVDITISP